MSETTSANMDTVIGRLVADKGLATQGEVEQCMMLTESAAYDGKNVGGLAGVLSRKEAQLQRLKPELEEQKSNRQILIRCSPSSVPGRCIRSTKRDSCSPTVSSRSRYCRRSTTTIQTSSNGFTMRQAVAKLNHANIVGAYDVGQAGDYHYFVMEYVDGRTVYDDISKKGAYSEEEALEIVTKVAEALNHAHEQGFIHRDVKPKNIMITHDGTVKLADMGLARAVSDREAAEAEAGKAYGTPYYISPEQIRGEIEIDFRADIYALGATAYHMVTGQVPFEVESRPYEAPDRRPHPARPHQ